MEWLSGPLGAILGVIFLYVLFILFFGLRPKKKRVSRASARGPKSDLSLPTERVIVPGPNRRTYDVATQQATATALSRSDAAEQLSLLLDEEQLLLAYGQTFLPYDAQALPDHSLYIFKPTDSHQQEAFGQTGFPVEFRLTLEYESATGKVAVVGRQGRIGYVPEDFARLIETRMSSGQTFVCVTLWTTDADVVPLVLVTTPQVFQSLRS